VSYQFWALDEDRFVEQRETRLGESVVAATMPSLSVSTEAL
jgi:hypothetical protein